MEKNPDKRTSDSSVNGSFTDMQAKVNTNMNTDDNITPLLTSEEDQSLPRLASENNTS